MIDPIIRQHIDAKLQAVAAEERVRILYAVESGSRAWGFGSPDSDFDVRFLYRHPRDWYVRLEEPRDVIERPLDEQLVDLAAWDIRKALRLLLKSNPALYEWLVSPIVYADDGQLRPALKSMFEAHASQRTLAHHYWSIARSGWKDNIASREQVKQKRYFYCIRPLLSLAWVISESRPPPMAIGELRAAIHMPDDASAALDRLIEKKRTTPELGLEPRIADIDRWIAGEIDRLDPTRLSLSEKPAADMTHEADALYRRLIGFD